MIKKEITPVEWLVEQVNSDCTISAFIRPELIEKAKKLETFRYNDAFALGLEFGKQDAQNTQQVFDNGINKEDVLNYFKELLEIDDSVIATNLGLMLLIETTYQQICRLEGFTLNMLSNYSAEQLFPKEMLDAIKQLKNE